MKGNKRQKGTDSMKKRLLLLAVGLILLAGCASGGDPMEENNTFTQIDQERAKAMMARDDGHVVVDVRRQDEYDAGHIPGAILIPNESIGEDAPEALPEYDQIILIYCRSGNRSKQAAEKLAGMGYTNVYEFGGITDWTGEVVTAEEGQAAKSAVLTFSSFDGGGHEYTAEIEDPSVLTCTAVRDYGERDELEDGSPYRMIFTFTGLKPGTTTVNIYGRSPIIENDDASYTAVVDEELAVTLRAERAISTFFLSRSGEINYDSYRITRERDGYDVSVNDGEAQSIDRETADALMRIIDEYDVARWDGFDQSREHVLDGEGFWLEVTLTDGTRITAQGENAFPENYFPAMGRMQEVLDALSLES